MKMKTPPTMMIHRFHPLLSSTATRTRCLAPGLSSMLMDRVWHSSITHPQPQRRDLKSSFHWTAETTRYSSTTATTKNPIYNYGTPCQYRTFHFTLTPSLSSKDISEKEGTEEPSSSSSSSDNINQQPEQQDTNEEESSQSSSPSSSPHPTEILYEFTPPPQLSPESMKKVNDIFDQILWLDMIEVHLLTNLIQEQLGSKWSAADDAQFEFGTANTKSGGGGGDDDADEAKEQIKKVVDIKLVSFDAKSKIKVIKEVRAILSGLGLKEAKELVESVPKVLQKGVSPEKAEELKSQLEAAGAVVELV